MPVDAVVGDVGDAIFEPFDRNLALVGRVLDFLVGLEPVDALAVFGPEFFRIADRLLVPFQIGVVVDQAMFFFFFFDLVFFDFSHASLSSGTQKNFRCERTSGDQH